MKCPIKLSPSTAEFIKKNKLVYVGVGNPSKNLLAKDGNIVCSSLRVEPNGKSYNGDRLKRHFGSIRNNHYFVSRADAVKHFPHCLPKARKAPPKGPTVPKGYVYLGLGGKFKRAAFFAGMYKKSEDGKWQAHDSCMGTEDCWHYCAPANSEIARLNGHKTPIPTEVETLREENAALKARIAELRDKVNRLDGAIRTAAMSL